MSKSHIGSKIRLLFCQTDFRFMYFQVGKTANMYEILNEKKNRIFYTVNSGWCAPKCVQRSTTQFRHKFSFEMHSWNSKKKKKLFRIYVNWMPTDYESSTFLDGKDDHFIMYVGSVRFGWLLCYHQFRYQRMFHTLKPSVSTEMEMAYLMWFSFRPHRK